MNINKNSNNIFTAHPLKENNLEEDFYLKSENNKNLFLKFSENARKKIENIGFNFDEENTKKENSRNSAINDEIARKNAIRLRVNNKNLENPFTRDNLGKSKNSNLVFDYYSKVKNPQSNKIGVENFTENLSKFKSKRIINNENKDISKIYKNGNDSDKIENPNNKHIRIKETSNLYLNDKNNFFKNVDKFGNSGSHEVDLQSELNRPNFLEEKNYNFSKDNKNIQYQSKKPRDFKEENHLDKIYNNDNEDYNLLNVFENNNNKNINDEEKLYAFPGIKMENILKEKNNYLNDYQNLNNFTKEQEQFNEFNAYIQKCMNLNKQNNAYPETNKIEKNEIIDDKNDNFLNNFPINPVNTNNCNFNQNNKNSNFFQESYYKETEQNYENFTQDFFFERYGHFLPSVLTPTSFNRDISQFLRKDKDEKSEASSRIINIKCEPIRNPSFNLFNKMNQVNYIKDGVKLDCNNKKINDKIPNYVYSAEDKEAIDKFDFSKLAQEIENAYHSYDFNPISICGNKITKSDFNDNDEISKKIRFSNLSLSKWINTYNKILGNESFMKEFNLKNFKIINADIIFERIKDVINILNDQSFYLNQINNHLNSFKQNEILRILYSFFSIFSLSQKIKENKISLIVKLNICKFVDSLKIFEAQDFYGNDIQIAYILPIDYNEYSNMLNNRRKNPKAGDIIFIRNFSNSYSDVEDKVYFIEEKDFEIIIF
jgi:hypothetical protein